MAATEDHYRVHIETVHKINATKLRASGYGVAIIVIVSKLKAV